MRPGYESRAVQEYLLSGKAPLSCVVVKCYCFSLMHLAGVSQLLIYKRRKFYEFVFVYTAAMKQNDKLT